MHGNSRTARGWITCTLLLGCGGCANLSYYTQLARGQHELLSQRVTIREIVKDESRDVQLRQRLQKVLDARAYATTQLALPDNASYTQYADLQRSYVMWNVFATPELSLEPVRHCFLFAGCVAYRGYFNQQAAEEEAARLQAEGKETYVSGVPAYSTLGWFDDPVINSMMRWTDESLIGTVFHELAHQQLYLKNDSAFNESFASFVEREGLRQYLADRGGSSDTHAETRQRQRQFSMLVLETRKRLSALYDSALPAAEMRERKQQELLRLTHEYRQMRDQDWQGYAGYDGWFDSSLNNAKLLPFGLYDQWVPAFATLFTRSGNQWPAFYLAVKQLSKLPEPERLQSLRRLNEAGGSE